MELLYLYSEKTFEFIETKEIEIDPFGKEWAWANQTKIEPPIFGVNEIPVFDKASQTWSITPDFRGKEGYVNGAWLKIKEMGALPEGFSETPPAEPEPTAEEIKQARITEINKELDTIDLKSIRPERSLRIGRGTDFDTQKLMELEDQADVLRAELQGLDVG